MDTCSNHHSIYFVGDTLWIFKYPVSPFLSSNSSILLQFSLSLIPIKFIIFNFSEENICLSFLIYLFIYSIVHLGQYGLVDIYVILGLDYVTIIICSSFKNFLNFLYLQELQDAFWFIFCNEPFLQ